MYVDVILFLFVCFKQKTAYEMRISDWSSDVCSSDLGDANPDGGIAAAAEARRTGGRAGAGRIGVRRRAEAAADPVRGGLREERKPMKGELTGGCVCGAVRYVLAEGFRFRPYACHCTDCQSRTGSAFSEHMFFARADLSIEGELDAGVMTQPSGAVSSIWGCAE